MALKEPANTENVTAFFKYQQSHPADSSRNHWILVVMGEVKGAFQSYEAAFKVGVDKFADQSFLIRDLCHEDAIIPFVFSE